MFYFADFRKKNGTQLPNTDIYFSESATIRVHYTNQTPVN